MDLIAINTIHRAKKEGKDSTTPGGRGTPPVTEVIAVGTKFTVSKEEADDLIGIGAARLDPNAKARAPAPAKAKEPAKVEEPVKAKEPAKVEEPAKKAAKGKAKTKDEDDDEDMI